MRDRGHAERTDRDVLIHDFEKMFSMCNFFLRLSLILVQCSTSISPKPFILSSATEVT